MISQLNKVALLSFSFVLLVISALSVNAGELTLINTTSYPIIFKEVSQVCPDLSWAGKTDPKEKTFQGEIGGPSRDIATWNNLPVCYVGAQYGENKDSVKPITFEFGVKGYATQQYTIPKDAPSEMVPFKYDQGDMKLDLKISLGRHEDKKAGTTVIAEKLEKAFKVEPKKRINNDYYIYNDVTITVTARN